ncbi:MAG: hypothetical protein ACFFDF_02575 [Candidatus Odinarchaeota archaeon]
MKFNNMLYYQKLDLLKRIWIISFLISIVPTTLICLFFRDILVLNTIIHDFYSSGKSIFLPFLPCANILWFLPKELQFMQLSIGQVIDIVIILNIIAIIERGGYQYYLRICMNEDCFDSSQIIFNENFYTFYQEPVNYFEVNTKICDDFSYKFPIFNFSKNSILSEELNYYNDHLRINKTRYKLILNKILIYTTLSVHFKNFQPSYYYFRIKNFLKIFQLSIPFFPKLQELMILLIFFKQEGKG